MRIILAIVVTISLTAKTSWAQVKDQLSGDKTETYVNFEFSADNKYAILMEANSGQSKTTYSTYLSQVGDQGQLIPASGKGIKI